MNTLEIKFFKRDEAAEVPSRGSEYAAGYDLRSINLKAVEITPSDTVMFDTGLSVEIPEGYVGLVFARSGLATREGLRPANCVGVIDSDYRGPIKIALHNDSQTFQTVLPHERIGQLVIMPYLPVKFKEVASIEALSETDRGEGGFGSTGKN